MVIRESPLLVAVMMVFLFLAIRNSITILMPVLRSMIMKFNYKTENNLKTLVRIEGHPSKTFYLLLPDNYEGLDTCIFESFDDFEHKCSLYKELKRITDGDFTQILDAPAHEWDVFISIYIEEDAWEEVSCPCLNGWIKSEG